MSPTLKHTLLLLTLLTLFHIPNSTSKSFMITPDSPMTSENNIFKLGFLTTASDSSNWYLGIWYSSIPTPTHVWIANRDTPIKKNRTFSSPVSVLRNGCLTIIDNDSTTSAWQSTNLDKACEGKLLNSGNLVLLSCGDERNVVWQSFDFPTDTLLPGMNLTTEKSLIGWKSVLDPSGGLFSLRIIAPGFAQIVLYYNGSMPYWTTGNWTGNAFTDVPEVTISNIYKFQFFDPYTPKATFGYTEISSETDLRQPLTRFQLDHNGLLRQFTWNPQTENWNMFWSQPEDKCHVYYLCGNFGVCNSVKLRCCDCLVGYSPVNETNWYMGDFLDGCYRKGEGKCREDDRFQDIGLVGYNYDGVTSVVFTSDRRNCVETCLKNCSCFGLYHNETNKICRNLYGILYNLHDKVVFIPGEDALYLRVARGETLTKEKNVKTMCLILTFVGVFVLFSVVVLLIILTRRRKRQTTGGDDGPYTNLRVFSCKELHALTRGFSEKLGQGGFGAVYKGVLSDSSSVAVKRLERPNGGADSGEKQFRAEVRTIGYIQHVNLVRLRGFCSESSHRLLIYDYMQNGPLSMYLKKTGPHLSSDVRFSIAVGTAKGIAYLHEECRDCIIHCDIKPENILLDSNFVAKVSDFGLAKLTGRDFSRVLATMRGTRGYVAPEWISGVAITAKADVYSFGMTLLELISGRRNVEAPISNIEGEEEVQNDKENWFFPPWAARQIIDGNIVSVVDVRLHSDVGGYNRAEAKRLGLVAIWCIQDEEATRPTMGMVVKMLEGVVEVTIPPPPKLIQALVSGNSFGGIGSGSTNRKSAGGAECESGISQLSVGEIVSVAD